MGRIVTFPVVARPTFQSIVEALRWYENSGHEPPRLAPPIDATGDEYCDAFLATIFAGLCQFAPATRVWHLRDKAAVEFALAVRVEREQAYVADRVPSEVAAICRRIGRTMMDWAWAIERHEQGIANADNRAGGREP